jgi:hypothetical protein
VRRPRTLSLTLVVAALASPVRAHGPHDLALPLPRPARPFLLVDAERRFVPGAPASVRVQLRGGRPVRVALYRLDAPEPWTRLALAPDGLAVASDPTGRACERLLRARGPLPRREGSVTLLRDEAVTLATPAPTLRTGGDESAAFDSSDADEGTVETRWVRAGRWRDQRVALGVLPAGLYLARVYAGAYAASALVSVSDLTLLVRRGDLRDTVAVATADGAPLAGVAVTAGEDVAPVVTDARGEAHVGASAAATRRFVARRGAAWAWAEASHARLDACDVRVYLDPGRPVFREGEVLHLRGHVRGCVNGHDAPLARESVTVQDHDADPPTPSTTMLSDADGNFVTELTVATTDLRAIVRGRSHVRTIVIDHRALPARGLVVTADRGFAAAGEAVRVRASDDAGGWPTETAVDFSFMGQRRRATVGPGHAAEVTFLVGSVDDAARREVIEASLALDGQVNTAQAEVWTGRRPVVLHVDGPTAPGAAEVWVRAENLGGERLREGLSLRVTGSDGNRAVGPVRWNGRVDTSPAGDTRAALRLPGAGPWWVAVASERGAAVEAGTVVWERERPPSLGARGALSVRPDRAEVVAGGTLPVLLTRPARGATWVTLEQSGVWASAWVPPGAPGGADPWWRTVLGLPVDAQGVASVVATHLADGTVETATAVVGVTAAPALSLRVTSDARAYPEGATMHATITARSPDGAARDGVVSLWLADEGYWNLSPEAYPPVDAMLSLPGRPASGADSARPRAWGADEGRHLDPEALWNSTPLPELTRYDAWNAGGDLVTFTTRGMFGAVAGALARSAGLARAVVCPARAITLGAVSLSARDVPWDLLAARVADRTDTHAWVAGDGTLHLSCEAGPAPGLSGGGLGSGSGSGYGGGGLGRGTRAQRLEGDLFFVGTRALGPDGRLDVDVPLPAHPGRWRLQALAIDAHGRGDRAHTVVATTRPLTASVDAPSELRPGDRATAAVTVHAPSLAGQRAELGVEGDGVTIEGAPSAVTLDARGDARATFTVLAASAGAATLVGRVRVGAARDAVRAGVTVRADDAVVPLSLHATVDARATDVDVVIPALAREAEVVVDADPGLVGLVDEVLAALSAPRWTAPAILVERLAAMRTLAAVVAALPPPQQGERPARVDAALGSLAAQLAALRGIDGAVGWWRAGEPSGYVTATMLTALEGPARDPRWADAWAFVRDRAATAEGDEAARIVEALAHGPARGDAVLARAVLARLEATAALSLDATRGAYAAAREVAPTTAARWTERLRARVAEAIADERRVECRGAAWFLCFAREGRRAEVARATAALPPADAAAVALRDRVLAWLAGRPAAATAWWWGSSEADVLALLARATRGEGAAGATAFTVSLDGREVARGDREHPARVTVRGAAALRVSFAAAAGRAARVHVRGSLALAPVDAPTGAAALERRLDAGPDGPTLVLRWTLPREATGVELVVPLPAGVDVARPSGSRARVRATEHDIGWWSALDRAPRALRPTIERRDGALHLRMARLGAGTHTLSLPLVVTAAGRFTAGGAWLRTDDPALWGVTPPVVVNPP